MAALTLALLACDLVTAPAGASRITPPADYRTWWEASRPCIAKPEHRPFSVIEWYVTDGPLYGADGVPAAAVTVAQRIYLTAPFQSVPWVIQHELVHAVNEIHGPPPDPFTRCRLTWETHE